MFPSFLRNFKDLVSDMLFGIPEKEITDCVYCTQNTHFLFLKGGDPAAPSGTTTLLRLHPPHGTYLRHGPPCG